MNIFDINNLNLFKLNDYSYQIKDFYKYPDKIESLFNNTAPFVHKWQEKNSLNTTNFIDCRHSFYSKEFQQTEEKIYKILNRNIINAKGLISTNFTKFLNIDDEYKQNYWWPHIDENLFNCIIYFNKDSCDGTNIYNQLKEPQGSEHSNPWQPKTNYELLFNLESNYNTMVIFKSNIYHGLAYNNHKFKNKFRKNQVIFID